MFDPVSLGIGAATTVGKLGLAAYQAYRAGQLKLQDTTTPEQREALAIARQRAASMSVPGQAVIQSRLAQAQSNAVQAAQLGSGSSSDYLASVSAANNARLNGEMQLGAQREQYNVRSQQELQQQLGLQAQQRQRDLATFNTQKASLTGAAIQNASNAIDNGAAYAAYGANAAKDGYGAGYGEGAVDTLPGRTPTLYSGYAEGAVDEQLGRTPTLDASIPQLPLPRSSYGVRGLNTPGYLPQLGGGRYRASRNRYGMSY